MACLYLDKDFNVRISLWADEPKIPRKNRGTCGAKTRQGTPCKAPPVWNITIDKAINDINSRTFNSCYKVNSAQTIIRTSIPSLVHIYYAWIN